MAGPQGGPQRSSFIRAGLRLGICRTEGSEENLVQERIFVSICVALYAYGQSEDATGPNAVRGDVSGPTVHSSFPENPEPGRRSPGGVCGQRPPPGAASDARLSQGVAVETTPCAPRTAFEPQATSLFAA